MVSAQNERSIRLSDLARVADSDAPPTSYVRFFSRDGGCRPAVTLAVAKRKGANAISVARQVEARLALVRPFVLPESERHGHAKLRRDEAEKRTVPLPHVSRRHVGVSPHRAGARPQGGTRRPDRDSRDARPDVVRVLGVSVHAEPDHALCLDLSIGILVDDAIVSWRTSSGMPAGDRRAGPASSRLRSAPSMRSAIRRFSRPSPSSPRFCRWRSSVG